ncbi:MAG: SIR2 family protein, partial [Solirubrobacteraceae bacterium]
MRPQQLFEALAEIASEHERDGDNNLLVVPVLTDELESRRDLLAEVAEFLGGVLLDVTGGAYDHEIGAFDDATLRGTVESELSFDRPGGGGRSEIRLNYAAGRIDAQLHSGERLVTVPSPAETQLMAVARAVFDARLANHELAVLLYDENTFDDVTQRAVLKMLTGLGRQNGLRLGAARTLVPFIRSSGLNRERHCQLFRGVRYSLSGELIIRRNPVLHLKDTVRKLTAPRDEPLVLFLGAGFSASSQMPVGNSVRNSTIRRICDLPDLHDGRTDEQLAAALFRFANQAGRDLLAEHEKEIGEEQFARSATLEQAVRIERDLFEVAIPQTITELRDRYNDRVDDPAYRPGDAVYALYSMIERSRRFVIITVNFDELPERDHHDQLDIVVDDADFARIAPILQTMRQGGAHPEGKTPLLKLHGTLNRPETCVATDEQTRSGVTPAKEEALMSLVRALPTEHRVPWVYVGASMRDIDLDRIFGARQFNESVSEFWVSPWPEPSVAHFVYGKRRWWAAAGTSLLERTVTETADSF